MKADRLFSSADENVPSLYTHLCKSFRPQSTQVPAGRSSVMASHPLGGVSDEFTKSAKDATACTHALRRAMVAYLIIVASIVCVLHFLVRIRIASALVIGLIVGQIALNFALFPSTIDYWTDFDSTTALYSCIQIITPAYIVLYAIIHAVLDRKV